MSTLEHIISTLSDQELIEIYRELNTCVLPKDGAARRFCRDINELIDEGKVSIKSRRYLYIPTLVQKIYEEMASRYAALKAR